MLNLEKEIGNKILHLTKDVLCFLKFRKQFFPFFFETLSCFLVKWELSEIYRKMRNPKFQIR